MPLLECLPRCAPKGVNNLIHSLGTLLKFGGQTVPMLSTNPLDPYSIAKSLIFIIAVNSKIDLPPGLTERTADLLARPGSPLSHLARARCLYRYREDFSLTHYIHT